VKDQITNGQWQTAGLRWLSLVYPTAYLAIGVLQGWYYGFDYAPSWDWALGSVLVAVSSQYFYFRSRGGEASWGNVIVDAKTLPEKTRLVDMMAIIMPILFTIGILVNRPQVAFWLMFRSVGP
jgi:hypothetical protein